MEAAHQLWPTLGSLLVKSGTLTPELLEAALDEQRGTGLRLGELLVQRGLVTRADVARALAEQHGLAYVDLRETPVEPAAASLLPASLARRYGAMPVRILEDGALLVAVSDPTNVLDSDDLRRALGVGIRVGVAASDEVAAVVARAAAAEEIELEDEEPDELEDDVELDLDEETNVVDLQEAAASAPAIRHVNKLLRRAIELGASDVHFTPQRSAVRVRARVDGVLRDLATIPKSLQSAVTSRLKIMGELDIAERRLPQDGRVSIKQGGRSRDLRVAVLPTTHGEKVTLRIASSGGEAPTLADLGMSASAEEIFLRSIGQPFGCVISCGPTGSGKTSTLYAGLALLNDDERQLTTIEDPVEHQMAGVDQVEVNVKAGLTFASGLRTILRSDPDVLLVGEIRDEETAQIAVRAALTGHLVLTTLHAHSAASSIARLKDMGIDIGLLAASVNCIVSQRLARRLCPQCRKPYAPEREELRDLGIPVDAGDECEFFGPGGCAACDDTGYRGRVGLFELMPIEGPVRHALHGSTSEIAAAAIASGMTTLRKDGIRRALEGVTSLAEVRRVTGERID